MKQLQNPGLLDYAFLSNVQRLPGHKRELERMVREAMAQVKKVVSQSKQSVSFDSVINQILNVDQYLMNLYMFVDHLNSVNSSPVTRDIVNALQPKLVTLGNAVLMNRQLYELCEMLEKQKGLTADQRRSLELFMRDMRLEGVHTAASVRKKLAAINNQLVKISEKFSNNVLDSRKEFYYCFADDKLFPEMPETDRQPAKDEAKRRGKDGYMFTLSPSSYGAVMKYCTDRTVRALFYKKANQVSSEGKLDNRKNILLLLKLRAQKAKLLGFKNFADYTLQTRSAPSVPAIMRQLRAVNAIAQRGAKKEIGTLKNFSKLKQFAEWDISFYAEQYRRKEFQINEALVREYFPLDAVFNGLQFVVERLFGITLQRSTQKLYQSDVQGYEVYQNGQLLGYYIADFFAHEQKRGGAWCNDLRRGRLTAEGRVLPIMVNVMNFPKPTKSTPSLLSIRDVETLFHEFGHALHMFLSATSYVNINGFCTELDFVEFPSQIFENWVWEPRVLQHFARHYRTGAPIPIDLINRLKKVKTFMGGYFVTRQNEFAMMDMTLHTAPVPTSVAALERIVKKAIASMSVLPKSPDNKMFASFNHIFAGGYSAGYYGYLWAEILEADAFEYIAKKGVLSRSAGREYSTKILSPGSRKPGLELFKNFMGREPDITPLLRKYGLAQ